MDAYIVGIGGVFLRAGDRDTLTRWYGEHLDVSINPQGGHDFFWRAADAPETCARTVLGFFDAETNYFEGPVMVNLIVRDLDELLAKLRDEGVEQVRPRETYPYGAFAWVRDSDGRWLELWEPVYGARENVPPPG